MVNKEYWLIKLIGLKDYKLIDKTIANNLKQAELEFSKRNKLMKASFVIAETKRWF